jgi:hypothetical protein
MIEVLEGDRPWTLLACLLLVDGKRCTAAAACLLILASPALKRYFEAISALSDGGPIQWLWEMNALGGQVLAGKDQLIKMFTLEQRIVQAAITHESSLKGRLCACAMVIGISLLGFEGAAVTGVAWYLLVKNTVIARDFWSLAAGLIRFLHFYTTPHSHPTPNHLVTAATSNSSQTWQVQLTICIWENERKWWPAGWTSNLNRSDSRTNFSDFSGAHSYTPALIKALKDAKMIDLETGQCGKWRYFAGDFETECGEVEAETRMRCWCWKRSFALIQEWNELWNLLDICQ